MNTPGSFTMQTVVQVNIYRETRSRFEYLLLKRFGNGVPFWQVVTEPVLDGSTIADTLRQATSEQVGLRGFKHLSSEMYSYEWFAHGEQGRDIVFAAEVSPDATITIDRHMYSEYVWAPIEEASRLIKWDGNRTALQKLNRHLIEYRAAHPLSPQEQLMHRGNEAESSTIPGGNPYGSNIPKRLPDRPVTSEGFTQNQSPPPPVNPAELFL